MAAPKKPGHARHLQITPYVRVKSASELSLTVNHDARIDRALAWYDAQPRGKRQSIVWELIVAAVNGELGIAPQAEMGSDDEAANQSALTELLKNMAFEDE